MLYLPRGKMNAVWTSGGGKWNQPPTPAPPHGVTVGECVNGRTAYVRRLFRFKHPHVYQG